MEKSRIEIIADSVIDGTLGIEEVWKNYGDVIRGTKKAGSENEALALTGLYLRFANYLANNGYLKDARSCYQDTLTVLFAEKDVISGETYNNALETIMYSLAVVNRKLDDYRGALPYLKKLKDQFPRKDEYREAYYGCLSSVIAKYVMPVYVLLAVVFLLRLGEIHITNTNFIPSWLIDVAWAIWILMLIIQFGLPWVMKRVLK